MLGRLPTGLNTTWISTVAPRVDTQRLRRATPPPPPLRPSSEPGDMERPIRQVPYKNEFGRNLTSRSSRRVRLACHRSPSFAVAAEFSFVTFRPALSRARAIASLSYNFRLELRYRRLPQTRWRHTPVPALTGASPLVCCSPRRRPWRRGLNRELHCRRDMLLFHTTRLRTQDGSRAGATACRRPRPWSTP